MKKRLLSLSICLALAITSINPVSADTIDKSQIAQETEETSEENTEEKLEQSVSSVDDIEEESEEEISSEGDVNVEEVEAIVDEADEDIEIIEPELEEIENADSDEAIYIEGAQQFDEEFVGGYIDMPEDHEVPEYIDTGDGDSDFISAAGESVPSSYHTIHSAADINYLKSIYPATRSQSPYGTCWAHSATAMAEFSMLSQGKEDTSVDYSELALAYFFYHSVTDPLGGTEGDESYLSSNANENYLEIGGNTTLTWKAYARGMGPTLESSVPYSTASSTLSGAKIPDDKAYDDVAVLTNVRILDRESNTEDIKRAIMANGCVGVSFYASNSYYNSSYNSFYNNVKTTTNHAVAIVGWDDNFPKENFDTTAPGDGAYVIRNSWSTSAGASYYSYFWISYYDTSLATTVYAMDFDSADVYDNNYQYAGSVFTLGSVRNKVAAIYTVRGTAGSNYEELQSVSLDLSSYSNVGYTIKIYTNITDSEDPTSGELHEECTTTGESTYAGYYTIPLSQSVILRRGTKFSVVVETTNGYVSREYSSDWNWAAGTAATKRGQSFYYSNNSWADVADDNGKYKDFAIKAFTKNADEPESENTYRIVFDGNGATDGLMNSMSGLALTQTYQLTQNSYSKTGYSFNGWNTKKDGTGTSYTDGQSVSGVTTGGKVITFYAQWKENSYSITFIRNNDNASGSMSRATLKYSEEYTIPESGYTYPNTDCYFFGWNTKADGTGIDFHPGDKVSKLIEEGNIDLYAIWHTLMDDFQIEEGTLVKYLGSQKIVSIPEGVVKIGAEAFMENNLEEVIIPDGVIEIGESAFEECLYLKKITWTDSVKSIGAFAFNTCNSLSEITLPSKLKFIGNYAFSYTKITSLIVPKTFSNYYRVSGNSYSWSCPFKYMSMLKRLEFEEGTTKLDRYEVSYAPALQELILPDSLTVIEDKSILYNDVLTEVTIPKKVNELEAYAISNCSKLSKVTIYRTTETIDANAIYNCPSNITIRGNSNSAAQTYASQKGYTFECVGENNNFTYSIVYDANGATSGSMSNMTGLSSSGSVTLNKNTFTRKGYTYTGWSLSPDGTGKVYSDEAVITNCPAFEEGEVVRLYARWEAKTVWVTYLYTDGTYNYRSTYGLYYDGTYLGNNNSLPDANNYSGYTFVGWFTKEVGGEQITETSIVKNEEDHNIYAHYRGAQVTISFDANGGTVNPSSKSAYLGETYGELPTPTRTGYDFLGWYSSTSSTATKITEDTSVTSSSARTLFAHWEKTPYTYSIKFDGNGATAGSMSTMTGVKSNVKIQLTANSFTREGYNFSGWNTKADGSGVSYTNNATISSPLASDNDQTVTLFAQWSPKSVVVYFKSGLNYATSKSVTTTYLGKYKGNLSSLPTPASVSNYSFVGWYSDKTAGEEITADTVVTNYENHNVYARYKGNSKTITFNANGGTVSTTGKTVYYGESYGDMPVPTKTGYDFDGWYTSASSGTKVTSDTVVNLTSSAQTLYAHWVRASYTYTIAFDGNGSTDGTMLPINAASRSSVKLGSNKFTKTGYTFKNWNTKKDGTGTSYVNAAQIDTPLTDVAGQTVTLYAQWTPKTITVTFVSAVTDATIATRSVTYGGYYNGSYSSLPTAPSLTGYYPSNGWYTEKTGGEEITAATIVTNPDDHKIYAHYSPRPAYITFNANGGTVNTTSKLLDYDDAYGELPVPTREGYTFRGWYTSSTGGTKIAEDSIVKQYGNCTLFAQWDKIYYTYSITFDGNGATSGTMSTITGASTASPVTLTNNGYLRTGYTFKNWNTKQDGSGTSYSNKASVSNPAVTANDQVITLYAQWTANKISATYRSSIDNSYIADNYVTFDNTYNGYLPTVPTVRGYNFVGFFTEKTGGTEVTESTKVTNPSAHIIYARYNAVEMTVSFDANGGTVGTANKLVKYNEAYGELPVPEKAKYTFLGWFTTSTGGAKITKDLIVSKVDNHTLFAHWEMTPITYSISFDGNGSTSGEMQALSGISSKNSVRLISNAFVKTGYSFAGWNTKADGTGQSYSDGQNISECPAEDEGQVVTLYAQWTAKTVTVNFKYKKSDGTYANTSRDLQYDGTYLGTYETFPDIERTGYTSEGWFTAETDGTKVTEATIIKNENEHTLYAHLKPSNYSVSFDVNGGEGSYSPMEVTFDAAYGTLPTPAWTEHQFVKWVTGEDERVITSDSIVEIADNHVLKAVWSRNKYTVTFDTNGIGDSVPSMEVYYGDSYGSLPEISSSGALFLGWFTDPVEGDEADDDDIVTKAHTLYAHWQLKYSVSEVQTNIADGSTVADGTRLRLFTSTNGAAIFYTLDDSTPNKNNVYSDENPDGNTYLYEDDIILSRDFINSVMGTPDSALKIKAYACKESYNSTSVISVSYSVIMESNEWDNYDAVLKADAETEGYSTPNDIPKALWVAGVEDADYSGSAITLNGLHVYDNKTRLTLNTDYTVKYVNNVKPGTAKVTITGKGNYAGTITKEFHINQLSLEDDERFSAPEVTFIYNKRVQKGTIAATYKFGDTVVTLKNGTDYTLSYPGTDKRQTEEYDPAQFCDEGDYSIVVTGKGNYSGTVNITEHIINATEGRKDIARMTFSSIGTMMATGEDIDPGDISDRLTVTDKTVRPNVQLYYGDDFDITCYNTKLPGTATAVISAIDGSNYFGTKILTFKVAAIPMSKVTITPGTITAGTFNGEEIKPNDFELEYKASKTADPVPLEEGTDYTVSYLNNVNVGKNKAAVVFTGINGYSGIVKKAFTINALTINSEDIELTVQEADDDSEAAEDYLGEYIYTKSGVKPAVSLTNGETKLVLGKDYTVAYSNNTKLNTEVNTRKSATITITGKGNYTGTIKKTFTIAASTLDNTQLIASNIVYSGKPAYKTSFTVKDSDGGVLKAGTDYENKAQFIVYTYDKDVAVHQYADSRKKTIKAVSRFEGDIVDAADILPVGAQIRVTVQGKNNYADSEVSGVYRCIKADLSKASVTISNSNHIYSGASIEFIKDQIRVAFGKNAPLKKTDYEIVEYTNNVNKGTASVTIRGVGEYGGTKTVKFNIGTRTMNYTVSYYANGENADADNPNGTGVKGTMKDSVLSAGGKLAANKYSRAGYIFTGWNTEPDGTGVSYTNTEAFNLKTGAGIYGTSIKLYAQWMAK